MIFIFGGDGGNLYKNETKVASFPYKRKDPGTLWVDPITGDAYIYLYSSPANIWKISPDGTMKGLFPEGNTQWFNYMTVGPDNKIASLFSTSIPDMNYQYIIDKEENITKTDDIFPGEGITGLQYDSDGNLWALTFDAQNVKLYKDGIVSRNIPNTYSRYNSLLRVLGNDVYVSISDETSSGFEVNITKNGTTCFSLEGTNSMGCTGICIDSYGNLYYQIWEKTDPENYVYDTHIYINDKLIYTIEGYYPYHFAIME